MTVARVTVLIAALTVALVRHVLLWHDYYHDGTLPGLLAVREDGDGMTTGTVARELHRQLYPRSTYSGGGSAALPFGRTQYFLFGAESAAEKIVLVHGIGHPCVVFQELAVKLASHGYRVLLYDQLGRGYTEAPRAIHDEALYVAQLELLLWHVGWKKQVQHGDDADGDVAQVDTRFNILGYSLGGAIATAYSALHSNDVRRLILVSPAGLMDSIPLLGRVASIPIINDLLVVSGIAQTLMKQASRSNFLLPTLEHDASIQEYARVESTRRRLAVDSTSTADEVERALRNVQRLTRLNNVQIDHHRGMVRSFFSTTTHFPLTAWSRSATNYRKVGADARQFPVWAVWGTVDELIPMALFARLQEWVPRVRLLSVQDAGHSLVVENVTSVLKHVVSALAVPVK